jgi:aryl-alcohol dehydrogenase
MNDEEEDEMKTTAAVVRETGGAFALEELELDEPRADEVQVRMVASGVCHTDAIVRDQWYPTPLPAVLGHEGSGIVERVGAGVTSVKPGDRVVLGFNSCGSCAQCMSGHPAYCVNFYAADFTGRRLGDGTAAFTDANGDPVSSHFFGQSSFSALSNVAERCVVTVPDDVPLELLGPLGCGLQTGAGAVLNVLKPGPGSSFVLFGTGAVGLSGLMAAAASGATTIIAVDVVDSRLELARTLGATHTVNSRTDDPVAAVKEITGGGANFALDTTGVPAVYRQMVDSLGLLGHGALVGAAKLGTEAKVDIGTSLLSGASISFVIEGDSVQRLFIPKLLALYQAGKFPFDKLIKTYRPDQINEAFHDSETGVTLKPVLVY